MGFTVIFKVKLALFSQFHHLKDGFNKADFHVLKSSLLKPIPLKEIGFLKTYFHLTGLILSKPISFLKSACLIPVFIELKSASRMSILSYVAQKGYSGIFLLTGHVRNFFKE